MLTTKKRETSQPRTLAELPEWQAAVEKQADLQREFATAERAAQQCDGAPLRAEQPERSGRIQAMADSLLGKSVKETADPMPDRGAIAERLEACHRAVAEHGRAMATLRSDLQRQLYESWTDEHLAARKRIAQAIIELKKSFDDEQALATQMADAGAISTAVYGRRKLLNFSSVANLPATIRGLKTKAFQRDNTNLLG
ncbi:MAG: hypothetical protein K8R46_10900 [Pirellulales bacterium]|nr:hypothetical protein [Pirellulales bacterium]